MNRTGKPTVEDLMAQIVALQAENQQLNERVFKLEEELALARLHRFAPRSEKGVDRLFDEAEQAVLEADESDDLADTGADPVELPDTGLPETGQPLGKKPGRRPLPANLPRERVEYDLAEDQKNCPCCSQRMHRMGNWSPSSFTSR